MNITIILPAVHVTSKRQQRDESPQPTTPFPPISITPSPTPFSEISSSFSKDEYKDLIEEYNREMAENHLSRSRAEIVARQAAYDDIQISRSTPATAGNRTGPEFGTTVFSKAFSSDDIISTSTGKGSSSAPCPYCSSSSDSKSEPSLRTIPVETEMPQPLVISNSIADINVGERRSLTDTSLSTDRATESPSSVDTVNTVIQSKAYDMLGELKGDRGNGGESNEIRHPVLIHEDSFDSLKQELDDDEIEQELQNITEENDEILTDILMNNSTSPNDIAKYATNVMGSGRINRRDSQLDFLYEKDEYDTEEKGNDDSASTSNLYDNDEWDKELPDEDTHPYEESILQQESEMTMKTDSILTETESQQQQNQEEIEDILEQGTTQIDNALKTVTPIEATDGELKGETVLSPVLVEDKEILANVDQPTTAAENGNEEVTIIVTQDDMPPADNTTFASDEENQLMEEEGKEMDFTKAEETIEPLKTEAEFDSGIEKEKYHKMDAEYDFSQKKEPETNYIIHQQNEQESQPQTTLSQNDLLYEEEEESRKEIQDEGVQNSDSAYFDSHHEFTEESYFNSEKIEDNLSYEEPSDKNFDATEQSYDASSNFEKDVENESGYDDIDKGCHENEGDYDKFENYKPNGIHHETHYTDINEAETQNNVEKMHRQHTLVDIPLLPIKKVVQIKKQKTEDFNSIDSNGSLLSKKKGKPYPDPRKPAAYPQRLNKTTLARQALAREKRRIYVEERIQNFMRNTKSIQTPYGSLDRSFSVDRTNHQHHHHHHKITNTSSSTSTYTVSKVSNDSKKYDKLHHLSSTTMSSSNSSRPNNHDSLTQYRKSKMESPQSLPDISIIDYYLAPSRGLLTSTPVTSTVMGKMANNKQQSHLSSSMSSIRSPTLGIAEVSVVNRGVIGGGGLGGSGNGLGSNKMPGRAGAGSSPRNGGVVIDSIPEETSDLWKAISSEEGYFYTFRVRQTGPVQMVDKSVQTQTGSMNFSKEFQSSNFPKKRAPLLNNKSSTIILPLIDDRDKILREIAETVQLRHDAELRRAELVQRANDLQTLIKEKRDKINRRHEFWHKKYIEESSMTRPLEAACNSLRAELNTVHRRLLAHLEGRDLPLRLRDGPSKKANYKIMAARLQHEIKELQQKAKAAKLRLESEIKLKEQAEREVRELRNDLAHKKVIMSLARSQIASLPAVHSRGYDPLGY